MAEMATYAGPSERTGIANAALVRGVRVTRNSSGTLDVTAAATRGDYVTAQDIAAAKAGQVFESTHGKVPALASEATLVGDTAYGAASGKFSKTSTNAAVMGRWTLAASGDGVLGEVELFDVA